MLFYRHLRNVERDKSFVELRFGKEVANARTELLQLEQKLLERYKELQNDKLVKEVRESEEMRKHVVKSESKTLFNGGKFDVEGGVRG